MAKPLRIPLLTDDLLVEVMKKALKNAMELIDDGDILEGMERYQRAYALYQLANEELGKALFTMVHLISDYKDYTARIEWYNKIFYNHKPKSMASTQIDLYAVSSMFAGQPDAFIKFYEHHLGFTAEVNHDQLENNRMNCFYIDVVDGNVLSPSDMITKEMCIKLQTMVKLRSHTASHAIKIAASTYLVIRENFENDPKLATMNQEEFQKKAADRIKGNN